MDFMSILGPVLGMAGSAAGGLLGGQDQQQNTNQTKSVADWLLPLQKAQVWRQYNLSNKDYQDYPGFFQQFASAMQQEQAPQQNPWDNLQMAMAGRPLQGQPQQQFVDKLTNPVVPLTAKPGERLPQQLSHADYTRYMQNMAENPDYYAKTLSQDQMKQWKKDNQGLRKYMGKNQPYQLGTGVYNQSVAADLADQRKQQAPNIIDQYYAPRALKGLLG